MGENVKGEAKIPLQWDDNSDLPPYIISGAPFWAGSVHRAKGITMFNDRSLVPAEAVRLLALGALMERDRHYGELATEIRFFTQRIVGPSLDLLGSSLELLCIEGLAEDTAQKKSGGVQESSVLRITHRGKDMFEALMGAQLRAPINDVGKLVLLLKLRFLALLPLPAQEEQLDLLHDIVTTERARAEELRREFEGKPMADWIAFDVRLSEKRLEWLEGALNGISKTA